MLIFFSDDVLQTIVREIHTVCVANPFFGLPKKTNQNVTRELARDGAKKKKKKEENFCEFSGENRKKENRSVL